MESFSGLLKNELIHRHSYRSQAEAIADVTKYIEVFVIDKAWRSLSGGICQKSADETKAADCRLTWRPNLRPTSKRISMPDFEALRQRQMYSGSVLGLGQQTEEELDRFCGALLQKIEQGSSPAK